MTHSLERHVVAATTALRAGDVVLIPTDTVYGLAADPTSPEGMARIFTLKNRPAGLPIAVLAASTQQATSLVEPTEGFTELAERWWPGALTLVAPIRAGLVQYATTTETLGVRVPDHPLVQAITRAFGPIATTSANRHGHAPVITLQEAQALWSGELAVMLDGGTLAGSASTVVDVTGTDSTVLRQGDIDIGTNPACQHGKPSP
ncbi:MAG: L-threonylcarbamoyladenylate synthase [Acidimicrobiales bacterium]